jgi:enoyl-CoA hydratase/carnithine racemase
MEFIEIDRDDGIAVATMSRGKVNAFNLAFIKELREALDSMADDAAVEGAVLTGRGKFFSFGFDVPEMYDFSPDEFTGFVEEYCESYRELFLFPKPLVAAINGHCVAGGCILALACDARVLAADVAKMALNEVTFGSSIFAGAVEMLRFAAGSTNASQVLLTGKMYKGAEAAALGLADEVAAAEQVAARACEVARTLAANGGPAFGSLKRLLREPVAKNWMRRERDAIAEFVDIWYSPATRKKTKGIQIR